MTIICISAILLIFSIPVFYMSHKKNAVGMGVVSFCLIILMGTALIVGTYYYIIWNKDSEIQHEQLVQERASIEAMLETDKDVDRIALNKLVIDYNNRVIEARNNSQRPIFRDYYSNNVDWMALETIDWR